MKILKAGTRCSILKKCCDIKMARSSHTYVRGAIQSFYKWLTSGVCGPIPEGPPVWICGDCHLGNLGPIASVKGQVEIAISDFDQTVIGDRLHGIQG